MQLCTVNGVDLTPFIDKETYSVNSEPMYESWQDGNFVEHRIYARTKIKGTFEVNLFGFKSMTYATFLTNWNAAVTNNVVTIGLRVGNDNSFQAISAYYTFSSVEHKELLDGTIYDKVTVTIEER